MVVGNPSFVLNSPSAEVPGGLFTPQQYLQFLAGYLVFVSGFSAVTAFMSLRALTLRFKTVGALLQMYRVVKVSTNIVIALFILALVLLVIPISEEVSFWSGVALVVALGFVLAAGHWRTGEWSEPEEE